MFQKPKRIQNETLLAALRTQPCVACGRPPPNDVDHVYHRGSGGGDTIDNCWPLCREHHSMKHQIGVRRFAQRFPMCLMWLKDHGHDEIISDVLNAMRLN